MKKPSEKKIAGVRNPVLFQEFARWEATPKYLRVTLKLPRTVKEFAEFKGVGERTLQRYRQMPEFKELVEFEKGRIARESLKNSAVAPDIGMPAAPTDPRTIRKQTVELEAAGWKDDPALSGLEDMSEGELQYRQVRERLVQMAMDGSTQAADLFMKHWGKTFVEAEQREVGFEGLSDADLVEQVVRLVGSERFAKILAGLVVE